MPQGSAEDGEAPPSPDPIPGSRGGVLGFPPEGVPKALVAVVLLTNGGGGGAFDDPLAPLCRGGGGGAAAEHGRVLLKTPALLAAACGQGPPLRRRDAAAACVGCLRMDDDVSLCFAVLLISICAGTSDLSIGWEEEHYKATVGPA